VGLFFAKSNSHGEEPKQQENKKKKKKWKNSCKKDPVELLSTLREVPHVFFFVMKVWGLEIL
jgi:hypothetical protein